MIKQSLKDSNLQHFGSKPNALPIELRDFVLRILERAAVPQLRARNHHLFIRAT